MSSDLYALAGAYVLDALDDDERQMFEAFMATSPEARAEVESLREVAALLGTAAVETPPEGLKAAVMDRIDAVRQDRPVVAIDEARSVRRQSGPATREWVTNLSRGAAAVAAVIAVGLGVALAQLSARVDEIQATGTQVAAVVAADDAQRVSHDLASGGHLSALISPQHGTAVVVGDGLAALDEDRMYVLWAIADGVPVPAGELRDGQPSTVAASTLDSIGLTVEPRGPLTLPTGEIQALLSV